MKRFRLSISPGQLNQRCDAERPTLKRCLPNVTCRSDRDRHHQKNDTHQEGDPRPIVCITVGPVVLVRGEEVTDHPEVLLQQLASSSGNHRLNSSDHFCIQRGG